MGYPLPDQPYRALVTGGAGFLGSHLCERLLARNFEVMCLDNFLTGSMSNIAHLQQDPKFQVINGDVSKVVNIYSTVDLVFHFASPASPADYLRFPIQTLQAGSTGTLHALEIARTKRARFVLASTSEVYGNPLEHPQRESYWGNVNPIGPRSVYDEAKRFAEALTTAYKDSFEVDTAIARIFNTYGPRMRLDDGRAIPTFVRQAIYGEPITVTGDGSQTRSFCYVDDTLDCILMLADSKHHGPLNIGSQDELSIAQLAESITEIAGSQSPINFVNRPIDDPEIRRPDTTLAFEVLGWKPRTSLRSGLERTLLWFTEQLAA